MTLSEALSVLTFQAGYNTAIVLLGAALLGAGAGVIGVFVLLRRRALVSDAISHATLPGVALGFLAATFLGFDGRSLPILLIGAGLSGAFGVVAVQWIRNHTRLPEDAAIGTVLSVFFGAGVVLLSYIQTLSVAGQAGLDGFLIGQAAAMSRGDAELIGIAAAIVTVLSLLFFKEFGLVCFDPDFAAARGWRVGRIDLLIMGLLLAIVTIGLKTVGLILIIALVIIPPVAARFWTERLGAMVAIAGAFGALSGHLGAAASALLPKAAGRRRHRADRRRPVPGKPAAGPQARPGGRGDTASAVQDRGCGTAGSRTACPRSAGRRPVCRSLSAVQGADRRRWPSDRQGTGGGRRRAAPGAAVGPLPDRLSGRRHFRSGMVAGADRGRAAGRSGGGSGAAGGGVVMILTVQDFLQIDLPALLVAVLSAVSCGLLGNYLVLRRQALVGDAISHLVLPGIVVGFLVVGSLSTLAMMSGALGAALLGVLLIDLIRRFGRVESGAAMGVVFTTMFAAGVVLLEQTGSAGVHLDVEHALYGALETTLWLTPTGWESLVDPAVLATLPREVVALAIVTVAVVLVIVLFFKELEIVTFDPDLATSLGIPAKAVGIGLIALVAVAAVAAFDAVGSILVIAMFICPASTARLLTDRLSRQLWISALVAALSGIAGYVLAAFGPFWIGGENSLNAAGMIAVVAGGLQLTAMLCAPRYGVLPRMLRRSRMRETV